MPLHLEVITPERKVYEDDVDMVIAPGSEGYLGILPRHAPLLTILDVGELDIIKGDVRTPFAVSGCFMEVLPNRVTILADTAERADDIEEARAEEARRRAEEQIAQRRSDQDMALAEAELRRAIIRLKVAQLKRVRRQ